MTETEDLLAHELRVAGHVLMPARLHDTRSSAWQAFARDWDDLPLDRHMADGGTYRRRRFGIYRYCAGVIDRLAHGPHYQSVQFNALNGGIERWFAPIGDTPATAACLRSIMHASVQRIEQASNGRHRRWHVEAHQFRIEGGSAQPGLPTPEGIHRDGRDWVLIMLIGRENARGGITSLRDDQGRDSDIPFEGPGDAVLLDDHRMLHGTSPITPIDPARPAVRDVLVLTFGDQGLHEGARQGA